MSSRNYFWGKHKIKSSLFFFSFNGSHWSATCSLLCKSSINTGCKMLNLKSKRIQTVWMLKYYVLMWMSYMCWIWIANCKSNVYVYFYVCMLQVKIVFWIHGGMWFNSSHGLQIPKQNVISRFSDDFSHSSTGNMTWQVLASVYFFY